MIKEINEANYENDEIMADLGKTVFDQVIGLTNKGMDDELIGLHLLATVKAYITERAE